MEDINCTHLLFVYGSMKKDFINHFRLVDTTIYLGYATTVYKYPMYPKNYDKSTPIDEWKLEHEYKGYQYLEHEIYNLVKEKVNG